MDRPEAFVLQGAADGERSAVRATAIIRAATVAKVAGSGRTGVIELGGDRRVRDHAPAAPTGCRFDQGQGRPITKAENAPPVAPSARADEDLLGALRDGMESTP